MNSQGKALSFIRDNLDGVLALAGAFSALVLVVYFHTRVGHLAYTATGIFSFVACVGYLVLRYRNKLSPISSILDLRASPSILLVSDIVFFLLFIYSLWSFAFRPELYVRPLGYFISIAIMSAILAAKILFMSLKSQAIPFTLFQIILIALSLEWSVLILFPSIVGIDPYYHQLVTLDILDKGHTVGISDQGLSIFHLAIGATSLISALSYKMATMLSISFLQVVSDVLFIFLIGRLIFNAKIGMMAALLLAVANWHIFFGYWTIPNTLGATFVVIILYLLLKLHRDRTTVVIPVCGLLMVALILTHPIAALWLVIMLFTFWLSLVFYSKFFKDRLATLIPLVIAVLFAATVFGWWTFGSGRISQLGFIVESGFDPSIGLTSAAGIAPPGEVELPEITLEVTPPGEVELPEITPEVTPPEVTPPEVTPPAWETLSSAPLEFLFNSTGMFLFFAVSLIGCFYMISRRFSNPYAFFVAIAGILLLSIGYFPMISGRSVIEHRWWYMAQILLSIPLAVAFSLLLGLFKKRYLKVSLVIALIFIVSFLLIIGLPSNQTNRTFSKNQIVRYAFTASEIQALHTVSTAYRRLIGVDTYYEALKGNPELLTKLEGKLCNILPCLLTKDFNSCLTSIILIRDEIVKRPIGKGGGTIYRLNYDPRQILTGQGFHRVYDSNSVSGFIK